MRSLFKKSSEEKKFKIHSYTTLHVNMLLYRSRKHFEAYSVFRANLSDTQLKEVFETKNVRLPNSFWTRVATLNSGIFSLNEETVNLAKTQPVIINSFGFTEEDFLDICHNYMLHESQKQMGQCPFCRIHWSGHLMRVLSDKCKEGTLERGGVCAPCIHSIWDEAFDVIEPKRWGLEEGGELETKKRADTD